MDNQTKNHAEDRYQHLYDLTNQMNDQMEKRGVSSDIYFTWNVVEDGHEAFPCLHTGTDTRYLSSCDYGPASDAEIQATTQGDLLEKILLHYQADLLNERDAGQKLGPEDKACLAILHAMWEPEHQTDHFLPHSLEGAEAMLKEAYQNYMQVQQEHGQSRTAANKSALNTLAKVNQEAATKGQNR